MAEATRVEVGFVGPQVITLKLDSEQLEKLRGKLGEGGWLTVSGEDGEVDLDLSKVAFVRVAASEHSVGFGSL